MCPVAVEETYSGNYIVVFDRVDGSANINTSLTTGSIFGIYGSEEQCLIDLDDDSTVINSTQQRFQENPTPDDHLKIPPSITKTRLCHFSHSIFTPILSIRGSTLANF